MKILAIETSADETGLAVIDAPKDLDGQPTILVNLVRSQIEEHIPYGGIVPNIAKREHGRVLPLLWEEAKTELGDGIQEIEMVTVTEGPGLSPCLWRGIEFAKELSAQLNVPLYGVNHLKGHVYVATLTEKIAYPALSLIVSGGHTELVLSKERGHFEFLGRTVDDAAGEAFDKVARLLGLGYPGGPEISRVGESGDPSAYELPRPMEHSGDYNFSFAGLKTAVMYLVKGIPATPRREAGTPLDLSNKQVIANVAASFQQAAVDVLVKKTIRAAEEYNPKTIVLGGGVAANALLREELKKNVHTHVHTCKLILPDRKLTTDNALMIALAAWQEHDILKPNADLEALPNLRIDEK